MTLGTISDSLIEYLLSSVDGFGFERLIQRLLAIRDGDNFVPLGGVHDGGADGFLRSLLVEKNRVTNFVQMSIQADAAGKIRGTVKRLREFGRDVKTIYYWTSQNLHVDVLEEQLSEELDVTVRIRDRKAVALLIDHDGRTRQFFLETFRAEIHELSAAGGNLSSQKFDVVSDPSVYVFLQFERSERFAKGGLVAPIVDALIYWSLRDTDPDKEKLITRTEIKRRISELLPSAATNLLPSVDGQLKVLTSKSGGREQRVREYIESDSFCLPYAVRIELAAVGAAEIALQQTVRLSLRERAQQLGAIDLDLVAEVCEKAIYKHFNEQGLILAAFLEKRLDGISISDQIVENELQAVAIAGRQPDQKSYTVALKVLQGIFYTPNEAEGDFLRRLSRTSLLLFSLKHCPKLVEYFNKMSGKFRLLVGTDILVKAMSESFLPAEHRHVTNLLKVAKACGAQLFVTAPVAKELFTHLHATHLEFRNYYAEQEPYITAPMASQSDRIFIRTYFYARLLLNQVAGWKSFINMFVDYDELANKTAKGEAQLQAYICKVFDMEVLDLLASPIDQKGLDVLADKLVNRNTFKVKNAELARNDALMVLSVYAQRRAGHEVAVYDGFGLKTWWLTKETNVLMHTGELVKENGSMPYIMRPEFLLNFLTLSPKANVVDPAVRDLLPSHVGLQIGQHLPSGHMQKLLAHVDDWKQLPPARVEVRVTDAVDQLKYDRLKRYAANVDLAGDPDTDILIAALASGKASN